MAGIEEALGAPLATATAFLEAAGRGDEHAAHAACTEDGWLGGDNPTRGLFRQVVKKGLVVDRLGLPQRFAGRAAQRAVLSHPSRPQPLGDLWLLLQETDAGWRICGATKLRQVVGLFLWGRVAGDLGLKTLPASPEAAAWAAPVLAGLRQGALPDLGAHGDLLQQRATEDQVSVEALPPRALPAVGRAAAGFRFTTPDNALGHDVWILLDVSGATATPVGTLPYLGLEGLLTGIEVDWPHEDPDEPGRALTAQEAGTDPATARAILETLVRGVAQAEGVDLDSLPADDPRRQVLAAVRRTGASPGDEPEPVKLPAEVERALSATVSRMMDEGVIQGDAVNVDGAWMKAHGAQVVAGLLGNVLRQVAPDGVELEVPVVVAEGEEAPAERPGKVRVKVDLADMIEKLGVRPPPADGDPA